MWMKNNRNIIYEECMKSGNELNNISKMWFFHKLYSYLSYDMKYVWITMFLHKGIKNTTFS